MRYSEPPETPNLSETASGGQATDLHILLNALLERAWLIALCVVVALLGAAIYYKRAPRIYEATATVQVEQEETRVVKIEQVVREDLRTVEILNTIVQKLRSRPLLERVFETNGLLAADTTGTDKGEKPLSREQRLAQLEASVKTSLRRNTRLIDIKVSHRDPVMAAKVANDMVKIYMDRDFEARTKTTQGAFTYLKNEAEGLKKKLETSEKELQAYREKVGLVSMEQGQDITIPQLRELSLRMTQARAETIRLKAAYDQVAKVQANAWDLLSIPEVASQLAVSDARTVLARWENDFTLIRQRYKGKHPKYLQAQSQLEDARRVLTNAVRVAADSLRVSYENARTTEEGIVNIFNAAETNALKRSQQAIRFNLLAREVESDQALFASVLNRLKETSLTTDLQAEKIRVVQPATAAEVPASPKLKLVFGLALLGGLMLGGMLAFGLGALDTSIKTVDEAEQYLGLPVLSAITKLREVKKAARPLVAAETGHSPGAEVFRTLRAALGMLGREEERRTFLFTSALPREGKSFCSLNFAASLAHQGLRTLLIDADLRRPNIANCLLGAGADELPGVTDYLLGRKSLGEIVQREQSLERLFWISAGITAPNPGELLAQGKLNDLIEEALLQYDRVVIDSAPIHAVSDTLLIADKIQTTVLVIHGGKTPRRVLGRTVQLLQKAGATMGGVVLNLLAHRRASGYYYYDSYHKGYYGSEAAGDDKGKGTRKTPAPAGRAKEVA